MKVAVFTTARVLAATAELLRPSVQCSGRLAAAAAAAAGGGGGAGA